MNDNANLFAALCHKLHRSPDRRGYVHIVCPECGKEPKKGQTHCSFSERGAKCFVCGFGAGLGKLAQLLDVAPTQTTPRLHQPAAPPPRPRFWQQNPEAVLAPLLESPRRLEAWQAYKPLSIDSIARWRLGEGLLPSSQCQHRRLVYPVFEAGHIVGFRGRSTTCDCPKWLTAGGSKTVLWGLEFITPGAQVIVVENPVDAMLAMQVEPGVVAVASTSGAGAWRDEWTAELARRRPVHVLVWLDHDLAGNGSPHHYGELVAAWRRANPQAKHPPRPNGPRITEALLAAGVPASLYRWPRGTPPKADIGSVLAQECAV